MSSALDIPTPPEPRRFSIRLPRPLWIGVAIAVLIVLNLLLRVSLPIYRKHLAILEVERVGGFVTTEHTNQDWLRDWLDWTS